MTDGNILIVDDSEGIRQSVGRYLLGLGYRCATAGDGREGLQKLREDDFDVALIDLMMPKVDGLGLLRAMEEADLDTVPIVLSGQAEVSQAVEATRRGAFDFIEKPAGNETIRWTVERALRHREVVREARAMAGLARQWEATFDAWPDMIAVLRPDLRILRVNRAVVERLHHTKEELVGKPCHEALCRDAHPAEDCPFTRDLPVGRERFAELPQTAWGGHFEVSSVALRDDRGQPGGSMHVIRDVTARKLAEWELQEAHATAQMLVASISSVLICLHKNGRITQWNDTAEETFAVAARDVIGRKLSECPIDWEFDRIEAALAECTASGRPVRVDDIPFRRPGGGDRFLGLTVNPMRDAGADHWGIVILGRDITDRRLLESQLTQAQKLEGIGQLAAGIAHEINTPMQYVGDNARFLRDSFADLLDLLREYGRFRAAVEEGTAGPKQLAEIAAAAVETDIEYLIEEIPRAVQQSLEGVERVSKIVRAMRDFSHPGVEGKTAADINAAIENTITVCRNEWKYVAEMRTDFDADLPAVPCLPGELNQVFLNLIVNAAHAIAQVVGDGSRGKGTIAISTRRDGDFVEIRVSDTGCGIPERSRKKVFEPFFTTKEVGRGTGQGLAIAHSVVADKHGGTITFETVEGEGTTFIVRLPLVEPTTRQRPPAREAKHDEETANTLCR